MQASWILLAIWLVPFAQCDTGTKFDPTPEIYEPSWTYKCVPDEGCQRSEMPQRHLVVNTSMHFESLSVCRTVCGRFGGLWPRPVTAAISMQTIQIHPNFLRYDFIDVPPTARKLLASMTHVISQNLLAECRGNVTEVVDTTVVVYISVKSDNIALTWDTDEQYMLDIQSKEGKVAVHVFAETVYGARHALESFSQLVAADMPDYTEHYVCSLRIVAGAKIRDRPAYKHRGLLIDTARNFIPIEDIKRTIDGMAATKMNVFHWHVTDSQSFPLESTRVPQFTRYGAYSAMDIYSAEEVRELVAYAQARAIRVVVEIDAPAHAGNGWQWGKEYGLGDLAVCVNAKPWRHFCIQPPCGQLNPANPNTYKVLRDLYQDIIDFQTRPILFHMGGDEVFINCWNATQEIVTYMKDKDIKLDAEGFIELWAEFHNKALKVWDEELAKAGETGLQPIMLWSSELTQPNRIVRHLDPSRYVIQVWEPVTSPLLHELLRIGYRTVSVPKDIWYLDHGFWGATTYSNWRKMYSHMLPDSSNNMLGGEVASWSEYVDAQGLDTRVWPRAAAVGERLWSNPSSGANAAEPRLQRLRERLINRGLRPDALSPGWCAHHDAMCRYVA
ncbi:chitooligosaccharidolytic beta-N-acetylglucosaminidase isoform X3 [Pectinophora gossypiella]|uniref:chitooligosaccharidolytic beta-N-acetylglucosaminidase isoform X3 n=1 Tax=Pectinophora gossypiella TaxID=13191 RepID=UPI00214EE412|nr:chitooligosaccharidolytic beta-N-acetylglucosaminidase isoform X3 [Pectinophora gossypiella]